MQAGRGMLIRATHAYGFRCGEWAEITGVGWSGRPCFEVRFIDGMTDLWPIYDPSDPYEFRDVQGPGYRRENLSLDALRAALLEDPSDAG